MLVEVLAAGAVAVAGAVGLLLWVDHRCELDAAAAATLCGLIAGSVALVALGLRITALAFPLGLVPAVILGLAGWTLIILLTTRPRPAIAADRKMPISAAGDGPGR